MKSLGIDKDEFQDHRFIITEGVILANFFFGHDFYPKSLIFLYNNVKKYTILSKQLKILPFEGKVYALLF